jgi:uncharacterized protein (DUF1697 family)
VAFFNEAPSASTLAALAASTVEPERFFAHAREIFLFHANGIGKSPMWTTLSGKGAAGKGVEGEPTCRNLNTLRKLAAMMDEAPH